VDRGFSQQEGEDYDKAFALVARCTSISLAASMGWSLHQMDVKTTFLNEVIKEEIYIEQPQGVQGAEPLVIQCKKELASKFHMKDLGLMHYYLGLEVWKKCGEVFLGQGKYVVKILQKFGMMDCKFMATPMVTVERL
jgi:hypothetical protein